MPQDRRHGAEIDSLGIERRDPAGADGAHDIDGDDQEPDEPERLGFDELPKRIGTLGQRIDAELVAGDVRLTMTPSTIHAPRKTKHAVPSGHRGRCEMQAYLWESPNVSLTWCS